MLAPAALRPIEPRHRHQSVGAPSPQRPPLLAQSPRAVAHLSCASVGQTESLPSHSPLILYRAASATMRSRWTWQSQPPWLPAQRSAHLTSDPQTALALLAPCFVSSTQPATSTTNAAREASCNGYGESEMRVILPRPREQPYGICSRLSLRIRGQYGHHNQHHLATSLWNAKHFISW